MPSCVNIHDFFTKNKRKNLFFIQNTLLEQGITIFITANQSNCIFIIFFTFSLPPAHARFAQ